LCVQTIVIYNCDDEHYRPEQKTEAAASIVISIDFWLFRTSIWQIVAKSPQLI